MLMSRFEFATATRIVVGPGCCAEVPAEAARLGQRALLVTGRTASRSRWLADALQQAGVATFGFPIPGEPGIDEVQVGCHVARSERCDLVIAIGGGSVLDAGKAIAAMLTNPGDLADYLEVIGAAQPLSHPSLPWIAIPTTAGTGAEVTRNAVLAAPVQGVKVSLRSPHMLARLAVVDPVLTHELPPTVTAASGLDTLTQLIEPFVTPRANPITDAFCRDGLKRVARSLGAAYAHSQSVAAGDLTVSAAQAAARADMSVASLLSGLSLANAALGAVHGFAGPIGGMANAPHGAVCAALLGPTMEVNVRSLEARDPASPALARYAEVGRILTGAEAASPRDAIDWVTAIVESFAIPPLSGWGIQPADIPAIAEKASRANSMKGNPIPLGDEDLREILQRAM